MGHAHDASMLSERPDAVRRGRTNSDYRYVALPHWALLMPGLSDAALRVYALLLAHVNAADGDQVAWPQQQTLAAMLGRHRNTISRAIRELSEAGLVTVTVERYGANRSRRRNVYTVHTAPPDSHRGPTSVAAWHAEQQPEPALTNRRDRKRAGQPGRTKNDASGSTIRGASGSTTRGAGTKQKGNYLKGKTPYPHRRANADRSRPLAVAEVAESVVSGIAEAASSVAEVAEVAESAEVAETTETTEAASNVAEVAESAVSGDHTPPPPPPAAVTIAEIRNVLAAMQRQRSPRSPRYRTERAQTHADARTAGRQG